MKRLLVSLAAGTLLLAGLAADAAAATITVGKNGIETIQDALDAAQDNDTIVIPKGNWNVDDLVLAGVDGVTIKGKGKPVLDGTQEEATVCLYIDDCVDVTVVGVRFRGATRGIVVSDSERVTIAKCEFTELSTGIWCISATFVSVEKSKFETLTGEGVLANSGADISVVKCTFIGLGNVAVVLGSGGSFVHRSIIEKNKMSDCFDGVEFTGHDSRILKNVMTALRNSGITTDSSSTSSGVVIEKNKLLGIPDEGMDLILTNSTVTKNTVTLDGGCDGLFLRGSMNVVEKNKFSGAQCYGILDSSTMSQFIKNAITNSASAGMYMSGTNSFSSGNKVTNGNSDGVVLTGGGGHEFDSNKVTGNQGDGIVTTSDDNTLRGNKVLKSLRNGIRLNGGTTGNVLDGNTAKKNNTSKDQSAYDINDQSTDGNNDIRDTNKYGTRSDPLQPD